MLACRTGLLHRSSDFPDAARNRDPLQAPQADALLPGGKEPLRDNKEPPLGSVSMVGMFVAFPVPAEYINIRRAARISNPGASILRPVSLPRPDVEAWIAARHIRLVVPALPCCRLLDLQPRLRCSMLAVPGRPVPAFFRCEPPACTQCGRNHAFQVFAALHVVHDAPVVPSNEHLENAPVHHVFPGCDRWS